MKLLQVVIAVAIGSTLVAVALSQQNTQSHSDSHTTNGNGTATATASSSSSSNAFGSAQRQASSSDSAHSGGSSSLRIPNPTHAVFFSRTGSYTDQAYSQVKQARILYFSNLQQMGRLVYFGPWRDQPGEMSILVAKDQEAQQIAQDDPAVKAGLLMPEVRAWTVQVDPYTPVIQSAGR